MPVYTKPLQIETDNAFLANKLKQDTSKSCIAGTAQDINNMCASFQELVFSKVNRTLNGVADALARLGQNVSSECLWLGRAPPCVAEALKDDCKQTSSVYI